MNDAIGKLVREANSCVSWPYNTTSVDLTPRRRTLRHDGQQEEGLQACWSGAARQGRDFKAGRAGHGVAGVLTRCHFEFLIFE